MLKKMTLSTGFILAMLFSFSLESASEILKCSVSLKTASPAVSGDSDQSVAKKWLVANVDLTVGKIANPENPGGFQICDEMDVVFEAIVLEPSLKKVFYLSGKNTLLCVSFDGTRKFTAGYIPPYIIDRIKPKKTEFDKKFFDNIILRVTLQVNGEKIAQAFYPQKVEGIEALFSSRLANLKLDKLKNSIIGRANTPWIFSNFDKYEWEK